MKSVLVANQFLTAMPSTGLAGLTRGQLIAVKADGSVLTSASEIADTDMIQFVVGLGDGATKNGVWVNPKRVMYKKAEYHEPASKTITFSNIAYNKNKAYQGFHATLYITLPAKNAFDGQWGYTREATVPYFDANETAADFLARFKAEIDKVVKEINDYFGTTMLTTTPASGTTISTSLVLTGAKGINFNASIEGIVDADKTVGSEDTNGVGTYAQINLLEKETDVASVGYNPNFRVGRNPYGDIFLADAAKKYNVYTLLTQADRTHPFNINTLGMGLVQWIAFDNTGTATNLEAVLEKIAGIEPAVKSGS